MSMDGPRGVIGFQILKEGPDGSRWG